MPPTPATSPETGAAASAGADREPLGQIDLSAHRPAAAELARAAELTAGELLAQPAPVRLGDVVPAPEQV
ncbi:beta-N-acetylhexosaminidase, partial [Micromonospora purpureochromogenes]